MEDKELLEKGAKDIVIEDFCEPLEGEQKEKCIHFYEDQADEEERQQKIERTRHQE